MSEHEYGRKEVIGRINDLCRQIGTIIGSQMPPGYGFFLALFTFGEGGDFAYISNAQREDVKNMMVEFITKTEDQRPS